MFMYIIDYFYSSILHTVYYTCICTHNLFHTLLIYNIEHCFILYILYVLLTYTHIEHCFIHIIHITYISHISYTHIYRALFHTQVVAID